MSDDDRPLPPVDQGLPLTPYDAGSSSGWSGSDTSQERAIEADRSGKTKARQLTALWWLEQSGHDGMTWKELDTATGWRHHGTTSGALSVLHMEHRIARLTGKPNRRNRCDVYVLPENVAGRETAEQGRNKPTATLTDGEREAVEAARAAADGQLIVMLDADVLARVLSAVDRLAS